MQQPQFQQQQTYQQPQQNINPALAPVAEAPKKVKVIKPLGITQSANGSAFFVSGGDEEQKKVIKSLGGARNTKLRSYRFAADRYNEVCNALKVNGAGGMINPKSMVTVNFKQTFNWPGDMAQLEKGLAQLGLTKLKTKTLGSEWEADLTKVAAFLAAFNSSAAPQQQ